MGEDIEWRVFALTGIICVVQTFFDLAPEGPWDSRSFTRGVIGLIGIGCLYISWFRFTFNQKGSDSNNQNMEKSRFKLAPCNDIRNYVLCFCHINQ
jgi:hypothetical protein